MYVRQTFFDLIIIWILCSVNDFGVCLSYRVPAGMSLLFLQRLAGESSLDRARRLRADYMLDFKKCLWVYQNDEWNNRHMYVELFQCKILNKTILYK